MLREGGGGSIRLDAMRRLLYAEVIHLSHFLFIIFHLTLCKLFERDISSLFSTLCPSISFSPCPFKFLSTVDVFVLGGEPRGSWCSVLGALGEGHPFSHWGSHQWGLCGSLIKVWPWMLRLRWTHGGKTTVIWSGSMTGSLRNQDKEGWWGNGQGIWGRGPVKRRRVVGVMLVHSRRVIQRGRKERRRKGGKQELEGCWWGVGGLHGAGVVFVFLASAGGM